MKQPLITNQVRLGSSSMAGIPLTLNCFSASFTPPSPYFQVTM
ncbi:MAG: hypothetical protein MjAS7_1559 [Metallosphaera javensis (ex Sakai et al. 2022)]|nr:MAG: hypothetical protein MjAS7_1559 [Metallosphaera javensis (ex Sakai et al. 2022)]